VALRRRYKLWAGGDDPDYLLEVENLRGTGGGIDLSIADLRAPESWPEEERTLALNLTPEEARDLVTVLRAALGEISETQLVELVDG